MKKVFYTLILITAVLVFAVGCTPTPAIQIPTPTPTLAPTPSPSLATEAITPTPTAPAESDPLPEPSSLPYRIEYDESTMSDPAEGEISMFDAVANVDELIDIAEYNAAGNEHFYQYVGIANNPDGDECYEIDLMQNADPDPIRLRKFLVTMDGTVSEVDLANPDTDENWKTVSEIEGTELKFDFMYDESTMSDPPEGGVTIFDAVLLIDKSLNEGDYDPDGTVYYYIYNGIVEKNGKAGYSFSLSQSVDGDKEVVKEFLIGENGEFFTP